jgi:hypothetical protein
MVRLAMLAKAPLMYDELAGTSELERSIEMRIDAAERSYYCGLARMMELRSDDHLELVAAAFQARDEAVREALRQATEFEASNVSKKPQIQCRDVEGHAVIEGFDPERGIWTAVWSNGKWQPAPQLVGRGRDLSFVAMMEAFPDASFSDAYSFAALVPASAFSQL